MAIIAAAAAAGLFGGGAVSRAEAVAGESFEVRYPRFGRADKPEQLTIMWQPRRPPAVIWFERPYLDELAIEEILPPPIAVIGSAERIYYEFAALEPGAQMEVRFTYRAERGGPLRGRIGADDGIEVRLRQLVFP